MTIANGATVEIDGRSAQAVTFTGTTGTLKREDAPYFTGSISGLAGADAVDIADISPVTIANGATVDIDGPSAQSVTFAGTTGTLKLEDPQAFTGLISGLSGADAIDLSGFAYGANVTATYLGNADGRHADGDRRRQDGAHRALRQLPVVDLDAVQRREGRHDRRRSDDHWQDLKVGGGGFVRGLDIAPDGTMVGRTDTNGAYLWNGSQWSSSSRRRACRPPSISAARASTRSRWPPSNSNIMYMMFDGYVFKSTNKGTTWTQTAFAQQTADNAERQLRPCTARRWPSIPTIPTSSMSGPTPNGMFVTTNGGADLEQA